MKLNIAIAGGGIAGLTAALALSKNGHLITVFERSKTLEDIGAGIQLSPNANHVLRALGLIDAVKAFSFEPDILKLVNGKTGAALTTLPFKKLMLRRYNAPYLVAYRGDLQRVLLKAAKSNLNILIQTGVLIERFSNNADGIEIAGKNFDLLIVADGIHSELRARIDLGAKVVKDSQTAWRSTIPLQAPTNSVCVYMNSGEHLVAYPMGKKPELNLVYVSNRSTPPDGSRFLGEARQLISAAHNWKPWPLATVDSTVWHKARAVMIGDAAHAMTPHAAQGGAMAIEDAIVLAGCIAKQPTIEAAFQAYQAARQSRIARVKALSVQNRAIYQMGGIIASGRNTVMPFIPPALSLKRLDWLYEWQP